MSRKSKRIIALISGIIMVTASFVWMKDSNENVIPVPVIIFTAGLIVIIETVKQLLLDLSRQETSEKS